LSEDVQQGSAVAGWALGLAVCGGALVEVLTEVGSPKISNGSSTTPSTSPSQQASGESFRYLAA
jgi:hypothetical protein